MIHIICALKCEAKSLIDYFKLNHYKKAELFGTYLNKEETISLTITGIGKLASAAGTMHTLITLDTNKSDAWLNIGVAGHKTLAIGQAVLVNRIEDKASGQTWYPQIIFDTELASAGLVTLDKACQDYTENMYDMEASGYYASICRYTIAELSHSLKIISDNQANPATKLDESFISNLVSDNLEEIKQLCGKLASISSEIRSLHTEPGKYQELIQRWHFTQYQRNSLQKLLLRWYVLLPQQDPLDMDFSVIDSSHEVLNLLQRTLDDVPIHFK